MVGLFQSPAEFDTFLLKSAMDGMGCNSDLLMETLCTRNNAQLHAVREYWNGSESIKLEDRIRSETSRLLGAGHFEDLMQKIVLGNRPEGAADPTQARLDGEELNRVLSSGSGPAKEKFIEIFTTRSWQQIAAIAQVFQEVSGRYTLDAAVLQAFGKGSDTAKALGVIADTQRNRMIIGRKNCIIR